MISDLTRETRSAPRITAVLAASLLLLAGCADRDAEPVVEEPVVATGTAVAATTDTSAAAAGFSQWLTTAAEPGQEHEYTANGLRHLAAAIDSRMMITDTTGARTNELRQVADAIQRDPTASTHAQSVNRAFTTAATLISELPGQTAGNNLTNAANAVDPNRPLLEQTDAVRRFFETARDAL